MQKSIKILPLKFSKRNFLVTDKNNISVMDYIPGGELLSLVDKYGCLPEEVVRIYVAEIALAIGIRIIFQQLKYI